MPAWILASTGLGLTSENSATPRPADLRSSRIVFTIGIWARPGSVTKSGRLMPLALHSSASSLMRPAPNLIAVGKLILRFGMVIWSARLGSEMEALGPRQGFIADDGQCGAAARILDAGPGQGRVEIVAAVHEDSAGLDLLADLLRRIGILGPYCGGEPIG